MAARPIWLTLMPKSADTAVRIIAIDEFRMSMEKCPYEIDNRRFVFIQSSTVYTVDNAN